MFETKLPNFHIRYANESDVGTILNFIKQLAEYEKLSDQVVATESRLRQHLFGERPAAEVLIGEFKGRAVGFALYFQTFSTFLAKPGIHLEDLFISPADRGNGFGKALLGCLADITVQRDCGRLEWCVLDWNQPAIDFYQSLGAETLSGWDINRLSGDDLLRLAGDFAKG